MKREYCYAVLLLCALVAGAAAAEGSVPTLPQEFWGSVTIDGAAAPAGTVIVAMIGDNESGSVTTTESGIYGGASRYDGKRLLVSGTPEQKGETITFLVDGQEASQTATFAPNGTARLDLSVGGATTEPIASFTARPPSGISPLSVTFTDTSSGTITSWLWSFGDGATATTRNATHIFTSAGTYTTTLTVSGPDGNSTRSATITVRSQSNGGGGGDGGGGPSSPIVTTTATPTTYTGQTSLSTSTAGKVRESATVRNADGSGSLTVPEGATALDGNGDPLDEVSIQTLDLAALPAAPTGNTFALALNCGPDGATFDPAVTLSFTLTGDEWAEIADPDTLTVLWYDGDTWQELPATVNAATHTVTARVSHFSTYALAWASTQTEVTATAGEKAGTTTTSTSTSETTQSGDETLPWPLIGAACLIIVLVVVGGYVWKKRG